MTIRELRNDILYEVKDQDQEVDIDDIMEIIRLWYGYKSTQFKITELKTENLSNDFILGWVRKAREEMKMIREYKANKNVS